MQIDAGHQEKRVESSSSPKRTPPTSVLSLNGGAKIKYISLSLPLSFQVHPILRMPLPSCHPPLHNRSCILILFWHQPRIALGTFTFFLELQLIPGFLSRPLSIS